MGADLAGWRAPYVTYAIFDAFVAELAHRGLPAKISADMLAGVKDASRAHLTASLRSLDLIDRQRRVTDNLKCLVDARGLPEYPTVLGALLDRCYPSFAGVDVADKDVNQLADDPLFSSHASETRYRAARFFLCAAQSAGRSVPATASKRGAVTSKPPTQINPTLPMDYAPFLRKFPDPDPNGGAEELARWHERYENFVCILIHGKRLR